MKKFLFLAAIAVSLFSCSSCEKDDSPTVQTVSVALDANVPTTVIATGKIVSDGGASIVAYGVCLGKSHNPTVADMKQEHSGGGVSKFTETIAGLDINQTYYVRAYAKNSEGIGYGDELEITTSADASIVTEQAESIELDKATLKAKVDPKGLSTEVWFEYGETSSYGTKVAVGIFDDAVEIPVSFMLTSLAPGKTYYFVAKCKNDRGEISGSPMTFETYGMKDIDGNYYHVVTIGNQVWLRENLKVTHFRDGSPILYKPDAKDWDFNTGVAEAAYCWYNNDIANKDRCGAYYNWYAAANMSIAPAGWHVPTYNDFVALVNYLGGKTVAGGKLKATGTDFWKAPNTGATNSSGFTALPCGDRLSPAAGGQGVFCDFTTDACFWSQSEFNTGGDFLYVSYDRTHAETDLIYGKYIGFNIRLVKD